MVIVLQACLVHYYQENFAAGVEVRVTVIAFVCCSVVTSDDGAHILHVHLQVIGVVQGIVCDAF